MKKQLSATDVQAAGSIFVYSKEMAGFDFGPDHPFKPERALKTYDLCLRYGVMDRPWMSVRKPEPVEQAILTLFHEPEYLTALQEASQGRVSLQLLARGLGTADNPLVNGVYEWSLLATGGTHMALQQLVSGQAAVAFNPLGGFHHARPGQAEGFCYLNDIAVTIKYVQAHSPGIRIAYVDLDAHHGNGVQEAFYDDPGVLFISLHETGRTLYPWSGSETETGAGKGLGFTVNVPLEPGTDDQVYNLVLETIVFPLLRSFSPDIIVAEIGADTLISDPLTHMKLTNNAYQRAIKGLAVICPRILALGGGGYDLYRTARCWTLAWSILNRVEPVDEFSGLVGGMMFGPEMEVGSLYDHPYESRGDIKAEALKQARRVITYIQKYVFPLHGLPVEKP